MVCYVLLCLMLASPGTLLFLQVEYIMQSAKCFETHMMCASSCLNIWRALFVSTDKWRQLVGFYYKILVRICPDDLEIFYGNICPNSSEILKTGETSWFLVPVAQFKN